MLSIIEKLAQFWFKICEWRLISSSSVSRRRSTPNVQCGIWNLHMCSSIIASISLASAVSNVVKNCSCCCDDAIGIFMMCFSANCVFINKRIKNRCLQLIDWRLKIKIYLQKLIKILPLNHYEYCSIVDSFQYLMATYFPHFSLVRQYFESICIAWPAPDSSTPCC